jgi:hypothetical protein
VIHVGVGNDNTPDLLEASAAYRFRDSPRIDEKRIVKQKGRGPMPADKVAGAAEDLYTHHLIVCDDSPACQGAFPDDDKNCWMPRSRWGPHSQ